MFVYKSRFLSRGEVWFDEEPDGTPVDWIYHRQRSCPPAKCRWKYFYTPLIDLHKTEGELFSALDEKTAYRITEAREKDKLRCERLDSKDPKHMDRLEEMWNQFAIAQNTERFSRPWLERFSEAGALDLVAAKDPADKVVTYHLALLTPNRVRQLIEVSQYQPVPSAAWRKAVNRANCLVHWLNFLTFKEQGVHYFDFGGWYPGNTDIRLLGMNKFKAGFGGTIVREYDYEQPVTLKGWVLLKTVQMLAARREARPFTRTNSQRSKYATLHTRHKVSPALR